MRLGYIGEKTLYNLIKQDLLKGAKVSEFHFCKHCVWENNLE